MSKKNILEKILPTIIKKENNQEKEDYQFSKTTPNFFLSEKPKVILYDTSFDDLSKIIDRYKSIDSWYKTTFIEEENYNHVLEIIDNAGELKGNAPYKDLVKNITKK